MQFLCIAKRNVNSHLFAEGGDGNAGISFSEFSQTVAFHMLLPSQIVVDSLTQGTGALAVHDPYTGQMGQVSVIQIFIQLAESLIHCFAQKIDFRADRGGF